MPGGPCAPGTPCSYQSIGISRSGLVAHTQPLTPGPSMIVNGPPPGFTQPWTTPSAEIAVAAPDERLVGQHARWVAAVLAYGLGVLAVAPMRHYVIDRPAGVLRIDGIRRLA